MLASCVLSSKMAFHSSLKGLAAIITPVFRDENVEKVTVCIGRGDLEDHPS